MLHSDLSLNITCSIGNAIDYAIYHEQTQGPFLFLIAYVVIPATGGMNMGILGTRITRERVQTNSA